MWQLFGEEVGSIDNDCFYIHRKNRMFNRKVLDRLEKIVAAAKERERITAK